jgi:hypothetical protein
VDEPAAPPPVEPARPEPEPDPQATVMPESLKSPAEPVEPPTEKRRSKAFPIALVAAGIVAAVVGFLVGGSGGGDAPPTTDGPPVVAAQNADLRLKVPEGWAGAGAPPDVPALPIQNAGTYAPPGGSATVMFGMVPQASNNSTLLPDPLIEQLGGAPEERESVALGPDDLQAYRYEGLEVEGLDGAATVYAVPTTEGVATIACTGSPSCDGIANTLQLASAEAFPVGPSEQYAQRAGRVSQQLRRAVDRGNAALDRANRPSSQADALRDLRSAYTRAARGLRGGNLSPADVRANAQVVQALTAVADAYGRAATAADNSNEAGYRRATRSVQQAQQQLSGALDGLRAAGYEIES